LRDRILTGDSLYLTVASAAPDFGAASLDGMGVRLVFKDRAEAIKEHVADRFNQVKDNWAFLVEEHTSKREALYRRLHGDITDLLRVDPTIWKRGAIGPISAIPRRNCRLSCSPRRLRACRSGRSASWKTSSWRASSSTGGSTTARCPTAISAAAFPTIPT
jgi:hypothetical protein